MTGIDWSVILQGLIVLGLGGVGRVLYGIWGALHQISITLASMGRDLTQHSKDLEDHEHRIRELERAQ